MTNASERIRGATDHGSVCLREGISSLHSPNATINVARSVLGTENEECGLSRGKRGGEWISE